MRLIPGWLAVSLLLAGSARALPEAAAIQTAFAGLDTSGNAAISQLEWAQASFALFRAADRNNDNRLDPAELEADAEVGDIFARADANRDGRLAIDEFMQLRRALFRVADMDGNDYITPVEYELFRLLAEAGWNDANRNGRIEFSELRPSLAEIFRLADADQDGRLSATEAAFMSEEAFATASRNGPLTPEAFTNHYRHQLTGE
jgi:Ca2+-binding EF-hand superfamily protein